MKSPLMLLPHLRPDPNLSIVPYVISPIIISVLNVLLPDNERLELEPRGLTKRELSALRSWELLGCERTTSHDEDLSPRQ
jgi:hypothetical protein